MSFLLKGGLIEFTESFPIPIPNVVIFQYNPETMTHGWTPATTAPDTPGSNPMAITGQPTNRIQCSITSGVALAGNRACWVMSDQVVSTPGRP